MARPFPSPDFLEMTTMRNYCIKLTSAEHTTHNGTQWVAGQWNPAGVRDGSGRLCGPGFYHAYDYADAPSVALILNPGEAVFANPVANPVVWLAEWRGMRGDDAALKFGATEMRVLHPLDVATPTDEQLRVFAILCAMQLLDAEGVEAPPEWHAWAEGYLAGERDRAARKHAAEVAMMDDAAWDAGAWVAAEDFARVAAKEAAWVAARVAARGFPNVAAHDVIATAAAWAQAWPLTGRDY